jgi:hypothetical protein
MKIIAFLTVLLLPGLSYAVDVLNFGFSKNTYEKFEKAEARFTLSATYSNPYDSVVVQVDALITDPDGASLVVPCFYYVPSQYTLSSGTWWVGTENNAQACWMLRYTPTKPGTYQVRIQVLDGSTSLSAVHSFAVVNSSRKGFVRLDPAHKQFMRFDDHTPYYPIGYNLCWNNGELVKFYNEWLNDRMAPNKINWTRYWLTDFARQALEWSGDQWSGWYGGLGRYSQRAAGILDSVLNNCERQDIYLQLVLQHHGQVSTTTDAQWPDNPYNTTKGGPLNHPDEFFSSAIAKAQTKKLYRYIVARWGYSTNILSWELFNEMEYSSGTDPNMAAWHDEMSHYLKVQDPNKHLVTTSTGQDNSTIPLLDGLPALDQIQWHTYTGGIEKALYQQGRNFLANHQSSFLCGEFGTSGSYVGHPDQWGDHVRKSTWIGMMSDVPNMFWYWDDYIQDKNMYTLFTPLANYLEEVDLVETTGGNGKRIRISSNPVISGSARVTPGQTDWSGTNSPNPFVSTIGANGNASNTQSLHRYIHGSWQGTRNRRLSFEVTFDNTGTVLLHLASVSTSSTHSIEVRVDGTLLTTWTPSGAGILTSPAIGAGTHTIELYNAGNDWIEFSQIEFTNVSLEQLDAWGYTGALHAYGYVNNLSYGEWAAPALVTDAVNAQLRVGPLTPDTYRIEYWDPITGAITDGGEVATTQDSLTLDLPVFKKDLAYKITSVSLPVALLTFEGQLREDNTATLYWSTASEAGSLSFEIEKSLDGKNFYTIGEVAAQQHATHTTYYTFSDPQALTGKAYYRLKQKDSDGSFTYSYTILLAGSSTNTLLYPNPATHQLFLNVQSDEESTCTIQLLSSTGSIVRKETQTLNNGLNILVVDVATLPSAVYIVQIVHHNGSVESLRFVKQ